MTYRHDQLVRVLNTPAPFYRLQVSADGSHVESHHLNITSTELGAIIDVLDTLEVSTERPITIMAGDRVRLISDPQAIATVLYVRASQDYAEVEYLDGFVTGGRASVWEVIPQADVDTDQPHSEG